MTTVRRCRPLLGTFVEISITDPRSHRSLHQLADIAFGRIARVHSLMSFHDASSELSRLNACAHLHPLPVNVWTRQVLSEAVRLAEASGGVFDIAAAGTGPGGGSFRDIVLHRDGRISFNRPLELDLGGIAKGFAVDKAAEILIDANVNAAVINAGGDLRFVGARPPTVSLRDPRAPFGRHIEAPCTAPAVATSAAYFANRIRHPRRKNHIVHPRTGKPMRSNISVSVFARSCMNADALTKVVLLDEPERWQALLRHERAGCIFLTTSGEAVRFPEAA